MKTVSQCDNIDRAGATVTALVNPASSDFAHPADHTKCCNKTSTEEKKPLAWLCFRSQPGLGVWGGDKETSINMVAERKYPCLYSTPGGSGATSMSLWITFTRQSGQPFINFTNQIWSNWRIFHSKSNSFYTSEEHLKRKLSSAVSWEKDRDEWVKSQIPNPDFSDSCS